MRNLRGGVGWSAAPDRGTHLAIAALQSALRHSIAPSDLSTVIGRHSHAGERQESTVFAWLQSDGEVEEERQIVGLR